MKTITINGNEYKLEFSFEAAENRTVVQRMFDLLSMAPVMKNVKNVESLDNGDESGMLEAIIEGQVEMTAKIPETARDAFYAGLLEHHDGITRAEAKKLMKQYMKENDYTYQNLYEQMRDCMEDDGFFKLTGISERLESMSQAAMEKAQSAISKNPEKVTPIKKKSTSTKKSEDTE